MLLFFAFKHHMYSVIYFYCIIYNRLFKQKLQK